MMGNDLISRESVTDLLSELRIDNIAVNGKRITEHIKELPTAFNQDKVIHKIHCHYIDRIDDADSEETEKLQIDNHVVSEIVRNGGVSKGE